MESLPAPEASGVSKRPETTVDELALPPRTADLTEAFRFYGGPINNNEDRPEGLINAWPMDEANVDYVDGQHGFWFLVGSGDDEIPYFAVINEQPRLLDEQFGPEHSPLIAESTTTDEFRRLLSAAL